MTRKIVFQASCGPREAVPTSWRPFSEENLPAKYEALIIPQMSSRRRYYEVLTYGTHVGNYERLADAKESLDIIYGPLPWQQVRSLQPLTTS